MKNEIKFFTFQFIAEKQQFISEIEIWKEKAHSGFAAVICVLLEDPNKTLEFLQVVNELDPSWINRYFFLDSLEGLLPLLENMINQELLSEVKEELEPLYQELVARVKNSFNKGEF